MGLAHLNEAFLESYLLIGRWIDAVIPASAKGSCVKLPCFSIIASKAVLLDSHRVPIIFNHRIDDTIGTSLVIVAERRDTMHHGTPNPYIPKVRLSPLQEKEGHQNPTSYQRKRMPSLLEDPLQFTCRHNVV